jgi:hypothetical protein
MKEQKLTEKDKEFLKEVFERTMKKYKEAVLKLQKA